MRAMVPVSAVVIGLAFVVIAIAQPAVLWDTGKVRAGREWIGDAGVAVLFAVVGLAVASAGAVLTLRRKRMR